MTFVARTNIEPYLKKPSSCVAKPTFRSQNCHVIDASPDDSVDQRQHTLGRLLKNTSSQFFQVVDTAVNQLEVRYDQPGLHQYMQLENALMTADTSADELKSVVYLHIQKWMLTGLLYNSLCCDNRTGDWSLWRTLPHSSLQYSR